MCEKVSLTTARAQHVQEHVKAESAMVILVVNVGELHPQTVNVVFTLKSVLELRCYKNMLHCRVVRQM